MNNQRLNFLTFHTEIGAKLWTHVNALRNIGTKM